MSITGGMVLWTGDGQVPAEVFQARDDAQAARDATQALYAGNLGALPDKAAARANLGLGSLALQVATAVAITGGTITGLASLGVVRGALPSSANSELVFGTFASSNGNANTLEMYHRRVADGSDWTTAAVCIGRKTDSARQGAVMFGGPSNPSGITLLNNNNEQLRVVADGAQILNNKAFQWLDNAGGAVKLSLQSDNNLVLYGTDASGAARSIWSVTQRSSTSVFQVGVRLQPSAGVLMVNGIDWTGQADSLAKASIRQDHTLTGTPTASASYNWLRLTDQVAVPDAAIGNGLTIEQNLRAGHTGSRQGILVNMTQWDATTSSISGGPYRVPIQSYGIAKASAGGTGPGILSGAKGHMFGRSAWARLESGATYWYECIGDELNVSVQTGASAALVGLMQLVVTSDHAVRGYHGSDFGLKIAAQTGAAAALDAAIQVGTPTSQWPVDTAGAVLETLHNRADAVLPRAARGVDLLSTKFSLLAFRSHGFAVSPTGVVAAVAADIGPLSIAASAGDVSVGLARRVATAVAVAAGGTLHYVGELLTDAWGGVYEVTSVSSGAVTGVAMRVPPTAAAPPANPVALSPTDDGRVSTTSIGCTVNLTWAAMGALQVGQTGGRLGFFGATGIVRPTITGANDGARITSIIAALTGLGLADAA